MKKVMITGASGFIGRNVTRDILARGYAVYAPYIGAPQPEAEGLIQTEVDLFDQSALAAYMEENKFENLIHLAWYVGPKVQMHPVNADWLCMSLGLLKSFAANGGKKFLGAGTVSEYDYSYGLMRENITPLSNPSFYGKCKAALYETGGAFCRQSGVDFKWARIFNLYGPYEREVRLMPSAIISMLKGGDVKVSACENFLDYLHVEDTAKAIAMLFESGVSGAVNISSGEPVQLKAIVNKIAELTNFKGKILWGAVKGSFADPVVAGANERLTKEVGWTPEYTLESGLKQTISWWKENLK